MFIHLPYLLIIKKLLYQNHLFIKKIFSLKFLFHNPVIYIYIFKIMFGKKEKKETIIVITKLTILTNNF